MSYIFSRHFFKWFTSKTPYLKEQTPIAPDITGSGVLLIVQCFRCSPLHWDLSSVSNIVVIIGQITRHTKVSNLTEKLMSSYKVFSSSEILLTLKTVLSETRMFRAARSLCTNPFPARYCIPRATC